MGLIRDSVTPLSLPLYTTFAHEMDETAGN
jgi:hypothetical protein